MNCSSVIKGLMTAAFATGALTATTTLAQVPIAFTAGQACTAEEVAGVYVHNIWHAGDTETFGEAVTFVAVAVYELAPDGSMAIRNRGFVRGADEHFEQIGTGSWGVGPDCHGEIALEGPAESWEGVRWLFVAAPATGTLHMVDNSLFKEFEASRVFD